jgi:hypothetical protein
LEKEDKNGLKFALILEKTKHSYQNKDLILVTFLKSIIKDLACKFAIFPFFAK